MTAQVQRKILTAGNRYQLVIILLAFLPTLLLCLFFMTMVMIINSPSGWRVFPWVSNAVLIFSGLFVLAVIMVFVFSRNLVGPFVRIIREMDDILAGRSRRLLSARPQDELVNEFLARVNVFIQEYLKHK